jgi:hypothetical protein
MYVAYRPFFDEIDRDIISNVRPRVFVHTQPASKKVHNPMDLRNKELKRHSARVDGS